jgi:hypothetical protein
MRSSHTAAAVSAVFDDENLIGYGGLEPTVRMGASGATTPRSPRARVNCSPGTATTRCSPTTPAPLIEAETTHRQHAIIEPAIADLKASVLAHLPSGSFQANNAWLTLAAIAHNLTRAASPVHAKAETATVRDQLIHVPPASPAPPASW